MNVRTYEDDTARFLADLKDGVPVSILVAPALYTNKDGGRLISWLKQLGIREVYDVSIGADICTWANVRFIQQQKPKSVIAQPCPSIVDYILKYKNNILHYLSPIHSPMLCAAIFMKKYERINNSIAAISPCIAKANEFEATGGVIGYNVTIKRLFQYIREHKIELPGATTDFDHAEAALGRLYSMPGGFRDNIEIYLKKSLRVDQAEGRGVVYEAIDAFAEEKEEHLPAIFDVLNCSEGCNLGTAVEHEISRFEARHIMEQGRKAVLKENNLEQLEQRFEHFDKTLILDDFMRRYTPTPVKQCDFSSTQIEKGFVALRKHTHVQRAFDCSACGCATCHDMAKSIVAGDNIPENCVQMLVEEITSVLEAATANLDSANLLVERYRQNRE